MTTDAWKHEERLAYMSSIVECSNDAILALTLDGVVISWNEAARRIFGFSADEIVGRPVSAIAPESLQAEQKDILRRAREGERIVGLKTVRRCADGRQIHVSLTVSPIRGTDGNISGLSAILRDISPMEEARLTLLASNQALQEAMVAADAANRAKSEFLTNMSHEIRTPMTAIMGFAELLDDEESSSRTREAAEAIRRNGTHLLRIINDLLDLAKIEAGKLELDLQPCAPRQLVEHVAGLLKDRAIAKGLAFDVDFGAGLPQMVLTDPTRVRQILINLLDNAIKFTLAGKVRIAVSAGAPVSDATRLYFDVEDTGIGIPESQQDRLFAPFTQGDMSATRAYGGTGLGLAISKRLAYMLGAEVTYRSVPEGGTAFRLSLPVAYLEVPGADAGSRRSAVLASRIARLDGRRVLVADDCPDNRRLMTRLLEMAGAEVTAVENGAKAVDEALGVQARESSCGSYDVLLMDMQMPVMDGYKATRELRQRGYDGAIIAVTAHAMDVDRRDCLDVGCNDYLAKPIDTDKLFLLVRAHSRRSSELALSGGGGHSPRAPCTQHLSKNLCGFDSQSCSSARTTHITKMWRNRSNGRSESRLKSAARGACRTPSTP